MDEILIEEKRYISSKRAAKVTGYAKDYIGQLCREGRVPARLVGRNWYVLETAIHDHRFGQQNHAPMEEAEAGPAEQSSPAWESPRYEASPAEVLPSVNRAAQDADQPSDGQHDASQRLQDSWKEWFDRVADAASAIPNVISSGKPAEEAENEIVADEKDDKKDDEDVRIPIRAIHHQRYQAPPEELLPRVSEQEALHRRSITEEEEKSAPEERQEQGKTHRSAIRTIQAVGILLAILSVILAIIGSGYFDAQISGTRASILSGIVIYSK